MAGDCYNLHVSDLIRLHSEAHSSSTFYDIRIKFPVGTRWSGLFAWIVNTEYSNA